MRLIVITLAALSILLSACSREFDHVETIMNVKRIYWHTGLRYALHTRSPGSYEIVVTEYQVGLDEKKCEVPAKVNAVWGVRIIADVPDKASMWARAVYCLYREFNTEHLRLFSLELHVYSSKSVDAGAWNRGKHGVVQTHVIE